MDKNNFNSSLFRYFKLTKESDEYSSFSCFDSLKKNMVFKISEDSLYASIFSDTFYRIIKNNLENFDIIRIPVEEPFDIIKFLNLQDNLVIKDEFQAKFSFDTGSFCIIDSWLKEKMSDKGMYNRTMFSDPKTLAQRNAEVFEMVESDEKLSSDAIKSQALALCANKSLCNTNEIEIYKFKTNTPIHFNLHKGEVLELSNPVIALALINQDYLRLLANSEEIKGEEKEKYFLEDFEDFVPGTLRKYYKLKENVKANDINDIQNEWSNPLLDCSYDSYFVRIYGRVDFYKFNNDNYRNNGEIKYFYVDYSAATSDTVVENEILKIAECLPQEQAILRYNSDMEAKKRHELELQALDYVNNHKSKYYKGLNRLLTPVEFMQQEEDKERIGLSVRLVKSLKKRISDIS